MNSTKLFGMKEMNSSIQHRFKFQILILGLELQCCSRTFKHALNFRFSPESSQESLKERFIQILEKSKCSFEIDWTLNAQPYLTKKTELLSIIQSALKMINGKEAIIDNGGGTSDGRWVSPSGSEVIELGPRNQTIHKIDEKISLADLALLQEIYQQILVETNNQAS